MRKIFITATLFVLIALPASTNAAPLTLSAVPINDPLQQQTNNPCVAGGSDCNSRRTTQIQDFVNTPTGNNNQSISWDLTSPGYLVGGIRLVFGDNFRVGLDFSQAQGQPDQVLGLFAMTINGNVQDIYLGPTAVPPTPAGNAGNGFADYILTGFDISGFAPTDIVRFHAIMPVANDGPDQAFLLRGLGVPPPQCPPACPFGVPEPASMTLLGLGFLSAGLVRRLRR